MWKEIFKVGRHTDANGNEREWSIEDLDKIVEKYNNQPLEDKHEAPVVIGHPVDNSPAYAWVESLKRVGNILLAKFRQMDSKFKELIKEGRYKKVSIALYPDLLLRHVGYLGAIPPAVKGSKDSEFNLQQEFISYEFEKDNINVLDKTTIEKNGFGNERSLPKSKNLGETNNININHKITNFIGGNMPEIIIPTNYAQLFQELLDWLKQTFNEEVANQTAEKLYELQAKYLASTENPANTNGNQPTNDTQQNSDIKQSEEFQELRKKLEILENDNREMKFNEYFKSQLGRLVPAQRQIVKLAFEAVRNNSKEFQFSENGRMISLNGEDVIKKLIDSFPMQVEFNEIAKKDLYNETNSLEEQNKFIDEYYKNK